MGRSEGPRRDPPPLPIVTNRHDLPLLTPYFKPTSDWMRGERHCDTVSAPPTVTNVVGLGFSHRPHPSHPPPQHLHRKTEVMMGPVPKPHPL
ncbi:hypothetical protein GBAR_LOCUS30526, partial [Geodia barretti]